MKMIVALLFAFSTLFGVAAQADAQSWEFAQSEDELTDEEQSLAYYKEGDLEFGAFCAQDTPIFMAIVPDYIGSSSSDTVRGAYRVRGENDTGVISYRFQTLSGGTGFRFQLTDGPDLVEPIAEGSEVVLRVEDFRDRTHTYTIPLTGSRDALERLDCVDFSPEERPSASEENGSEESSQQASWQATESGEILRLEETGEAIAFTCNPRALGLSLNEPIDSASSGEFVVGLKFETGKESEVAAYIFEYDRDRRIAVLSDTDEIDRLSASMLAHDQMTLSLYTTAQELEPLTLDLEGFEEAFDNASCFDSNAQ